MDGLDDLLKEYWPIVVGVVVVFLTAIVVWPSNEPAAKDPNREPVFVSPITDEVRRALEQKQTNESEAEPRPSETLAPTKSEAAPAQYGFLEIVEAFPLVDSESVGRKFTTDDPEVQQALGKIEVTLYLENECSSCTAVRSFLERSGISVMAQNVEDDSNKRERARRLSGSRSLPVLVVDGKVLQGLSDEAVQAALTSAVKRRVEADARAKSGL